MCVRTCKLSQDVGQDVRETRKPKALRKTQRSKGAPDQPDLYSGHSAPYTKVGKLLRWGAHVCAEVAFDTLKQTLRKSISYFPMPL